MPIRSANDRGSLTPALGRGRLDSSNMGARAGGVGGLGLVTDFCVFTILMGYAPRPLLMRLFSLAAATIVTWRLNRALTFDESGRRQHDEAVRYAAVTAAAQGTSYAVFATLVLTVLGALPQAALLAGAAAGALISYNGHRLFAFAPRGDR